VLHRGLNDGNMMEETWFFWVFTVTLL